MEIRLHGRGGQGGVTCAKILAAVYARLGQSVQAFGDYAGERSGAPVRAYLRVSDQVITNRNKVYTPDHLLVLDATLLSEQTTAGLARGGTLLVNSPLPPAELAGRFQGFRLATVDATAIARRHGIGTRSVVIVNTTIVGAVAKLLGIDLAVVQATYEGLGFGSNFAAAEEAFQAVREAADTSAAAAGADRAEQASVAGVGVLAPPGGGEVLDLLEHTVGLPTPLKTGSWRSQMPRYQQHKHSRVAPCNASCPAGNDVVGFVQALARGDEAEAAAILARSTPLPGVCGRVCPAFCMMGCNRREHDGSVNVRALERYVADHVAAPTIAIPTPQKVRRVAIVGGGPAGLAAAFELSRRGHQAVIYEREPVLGGVLHTGIPKFRLPPEVVEREVARILGLGVEARCGELLTGERLTELLEQHDGVIVATGLQWLRGLRLPGAELMGIEQGIHFLHRISAGDPPALSGHVVVLGGGNTAMDCARSALRLGAAEVTVAYRRTRKEMPAIAEEVDEAEREGIAMLYQRAPSGFAGDGRVQAIELCEVEMGPPDDSGRRRPVLTDRKVTLACDLVLLALGQGVEDGVFPPGLELADGRFSLAGKPLHMFAAGDVGTQEGTVTHAIGDGRRAATRLLAALGEDVEIFSRPALDQAVTPAEIRFEHFAPRAPAQPEHLPAGERGHRNSFEEVVRGLDDASEAERCLGCGYCTRCDTCLVYCPEGIISRAERDAFYEINKDYCKGCGICVVECPRCGMTMVAE